MAETSPNATFRELMQGRKGQMWNAATWPAHDRELAKRGIQDYEEGQQRRRWLEAQPASPEEHTLAWSQAMAELPGLLDRAMSGRATPKEQDALKRLLAKDRDYKQTGRWTIDVPGGQHLAGLA